MVSSGRGAICVSASSWGFGEWGSVPSDFLGERGESGKPGRSSDPGRLDRGSKASNDLFPLLLCFLGKGETSHFAFSFSRSHFSSSNKSSLDMFNFLFPRKEPNSSSPVMMRAYHTFEDTLDIIGFSRTHSDITNSFPPFCSRSGIDPTLIRLN